MFSLKNPLPQQLKDTTRLSNFYKQYNLVPYVEWSTVTAHKFLKVLSDLPQLSGTHGSCIRDLMKWSFGGNLEFVERSVPGLNIDRQELSDNEEVRIALELEKYGVTPALICGITKKLFQSRKKTGDFYLRYKEVRAGDTKRVFLEVLPPMQVMYLNTKEGEPKAVVVSKDFMYNDAFTEEPRLIRVYPDFSGTQDERETVIHVKTETEEELWYGRPDTLHVLYWMAAEWYQALHSLKVTKTETVAKAILAMMNPDPNSLKQGESVTSVARENRVQINRLMTNKGQDSKVDSIGVVNYPNGGQPPTLLTLDINRDYQYLQTSVKVASDYITAAHGWDKILFGFERPSSGIGGNVMIDTFLVKNTSTIKPIQREYEAEPWGTVFRLMAEFTGVQDFANVAPRFEDRVTSLVESLNELRSKNNANGNNNIDTAARSQGTGEDQQARTDV